MKRHLSILAAVLVALGYTSAAWANAPAPWWSCEAKAVGDTCEQYPAGTGICEVDTNCTDDDATEVDECLRCADDPAGGCSTAATGGLTGLSLLLLAGIAVSLRRRRS